MDWTLAGLLGAALAPTDPAVMFSVLGRREVGGRSGTTLEGEAGMNDPAGIALMIGMIELATHDDATVLVVGREFPWRWSSAPRSACWVAGLILPLLRRSRLPSESLYPILALTLAGVAVRGGVRCPWLRVPGRLPRRAARRRCAAALQGRDRAVPELACRTGRAGGVRRARATIHLAELGARDWLEGLALSRPWRS